MSGESSSQPARVPADIRHGVLRLAQRLRAERPPEALSDNKLGVLSHLYRCGPSTPGQIAAVKHQHPQSLTRVFAELEHAGLVTRSRSARDGRAAVLELTAEGRDELVRDMAMRDAWLARALTALTTAEVDLLYIAAALMDRIADPPDGDGNGMR